MELTLSYNEFLSELTEFNKIIMNENTTNKMIERARFGLGRCFINTDFAHEDKNLTSELQKIAHEVQLSNASRRMEWLILKSYEKTYLDK